MNRYFPQDDGRTHINIYTKGKTELGRQLTNLHDCVFTVPSYGTFNSLEGFWYYFFTGCKYQQLMSMGGFAAKRFGKTLWADRIDDEELGPTDEQKAVILEAIRCKLRQNKHILYALAESTLPLAHYYVPKGKEMSVQYGLSKFDWMTEELERLRTLMKEHLKKKSCK